MKRNQEIPLAELIRPQNLKDFVGQKNIISFGSSLRLQIENNSMGSSIFYGPAGTGKTTLARIIQNLSKAVYKKLNAVTSKIDDLRRVIKEAEAIEQKFILFIDEIHRFNKTQQDVLLPAVESGIITLIGATTENPYFSLISPLISRVTVYRFEALSIYEIEERLKQVSESLSDLYLDEPILVELESDAAHHIAVLSGGDLRNSLNIFERAFKYEKIRLEMLEKNKRLIIININSVNEVAKSKFYNYDRNAENHYNYISAFIKSMRGSDPDATIYYLAKMIESGEQPVFIARRIVILASEDIGLADPFALILANSAFESVKKIGWPEARIILSQAALYMACAPKSNSAYKAINEAIEFVKKNQDIPIPSALHSNPMKNFKGVSKKTYFYPHDYNDSFVEQKYMSEYINFYKPNDQGHEAKFKNRLNRLWKSRKYL